MATSPKQRYEQASGAVEALPGDLAARLLGAAAGGPGSDSSPGTGATGSKRVPVRVSQDKDKLLKKLTHRTGRYTPIVGERPLSKLQKAAVCAAATQAYAVQRSHGLVDDGVSAEAWRRAEQRELIGVESLTQALQLHYRKLMGHFKALAGGTVEALDDLTREDDDTDRQHAAAALNAAIEELSLTSAKRGRLEPMGIHAARGYALKIARDKSVTGEIRSLDDAVKAWPVRRIWELVYTLGSRARKMDGRNR